MCTTVGCSPHNGSDDAFVAKLTEPFPWEIFLPAILKGARKEAP